MTDDEIRDLGLSIEGLNLKEQPDGSKDFHPYIYNLVREVVARALASQWIDFNEKKPQDGQTIILLCVSPLEEGHPDYYPATYDSDCLKIGEFSIEDDGRMVVKDTYAHYEDGDHYSKLTHWMPLPELPNNETKGDRHDS